jgi:hypothetical protein
MKIGDHIVFSPETVRVYKLNSNQGLIVGRLQNDAVGYPDDYNVLISGEVVHMGFSLEESNNAEVINESR